MKRSNLALMLCGPAFLLSIPAAAETDLLSKLVSKPGELIAWGADAELRKDKEVKGGVAMRISTSGKEANTWDVGVYTPIVKPVHSGDKIILAFWARLESGADGAAAATLPRNAVQESEPPNPALFSEAVTVTPKWQLFQVSGIANKNYPAGSLNAALQLASGKQVVDIGPVYVFDMGQ